MEICGADLAAIARVIAEATQVETTELHVSGISGPNQWAGYDAALEALYRPLLQKPRKPEPSVNLVGWMWPSRRRNHEIGCCMAMLKELGIPVNTVVSGGSTLADIEKSVNASVNAVVCSSLMATCSTRWISTACAWPANRAPLRLQRHQRMAVKTSPRRWGWTPPPASPPCARAYEPKFLENKAR